MEWTAAQQHELHRFLAGFTSPDPQVQASNLQQLDALQQYPHALYSVGAVVCDGSSPPTIRIAAATVARQLLRRPSRLHFYLGSGATEVGRETALQQLISSLLQSLFEAALPPFPALLQRATVGLITALLRAAAVDPTHFATAVSAWCNLLSYLLHVTAQASASSALSEDALSTAAFDAGAKAAALLRELCAVVLTASRPLREWVGGQLQQSTDLGCVFLKQLQLLRSALRAHPHVHPDSLARARALAAWTEDLLAAFSSCMDSGALPSTAFDALDSAEPELGDGPAVQALRTISAAVAQIHSDIQDITLHLVLGPLALFHGGAGTAAAASDLQHLLRSTAPFISATIRYMADAVLQESLDVLNGNFQRVAMPLLASYCEGAASTQLLYDGAGDADSVHAAVVACVSYAAQLVHVQHFLGLPPTRAGKPSPYDPASTTASYVASLHRMLVSAATLPTCIAGQLPEHTVNEPDSATEMLVKSVSARRRSQRGVHASGISKSRELGDVNDDGSGGDEDEEEDAEELAMADALEAQLPDNGTLRQAVAWCANSLTCNVEWMAALMPLVIAPPQLSPPAQLSDVCVAEASLFVCNEVLSSMLADTSVLEAAPCEALAAQLRGVLQLLPVPSSDTSAVAGTLFFLRVQAARYVGRLGSGLMEAWKGLHQQAEESSSHTAGSRTQWMVHRTRTALSPAGGVGGALWTLTQVLEAEVHKAVQVECVRMIAALITNFFRALEALAHIDGKRSSTDASDSEGELVDASSGSRSDEDDDGVTHLAQRQNTSTASAEHVALLCQSLSLTPGFPALPQALLLVSQGLPRFQWSVRQSIYHLVSEALPPLWTLSQQQTSELWACGDHSAAAATQSLVRSVTAQSLEVLAAHYMGLLSDVRNSLFEMASLLSCMADVTTVMDAAALEGVLPWILQVAHHVLNLYAEYLACCASNEDTASSSSTPCAPFDAAVDMTDMCMVSLDLISCVCDGLIDRDALLALQLCPHKQEEVAAMDARVMALAASLLNPLAGTNSSSSSGPASTIDSALPDRCVALLTLCQSRLDHPSRAALAAPSTTSPQKEIFGRAADEFGEVRRACFAILYDCIFLLAYSESLYRPSVTQSDTTASGCGLSHSLGKDLLALCLREVTPRGAAMERLSECAVSAEELKAVSTRNAAASDAWLCLGALLCLWDQQSCRAEKRHPLNAEALLRDHHASERIHASRPASLISSALGPDPLQSQQYVQHVFESLLTLLADRSFAAVSYLKLNMISAACGVATVLASGSTNSLLPQHQLSQNHLVTLFGVVSSTRVREYVSDAARGGVAGVSEAGQVLWCLGRVWQDAAQALPHEALCALLRAQGKDMAKTAAWLVRCITAHAASLPLLTCPFWASLVELWQPLALTLTHNAQAGVVSLTLAQTASLRQLLQL
ncbi:hypothetical protein ABL78_5198 [Leptomonas seymouri]|uniref:Uncharacterized protein n=1 Tax=Leptomonas seymouri TaxID=5684 RepID=A0A0N0P4V7_LEPSE|nr:hypothetical protein ABL78_5198 [Leptomonas seymouri]|eukprot:KPI85749.1 hypothetical protein ABL78_5198 [Leptomonas seymouri]